MGLDDIPNWDDDVPESQPQNEVPPEEVNIASDSVYIGSYLEKVLGENIPHQRALKVKCSVGTYILSLKLNLN